MINFSQPDTIDERAINKKKLTPFTISVSTSWIGTCHKWKSKVFFCFNDRSGGEKKVIKILCNKKILQHEVVFLNKLCCILLFLRWFTEKTWFFMLSLILSLLAVFVLLYWVPKKIILDFEWMVRLYFSNAESICMAVYCVVGFCTFNTGEQLGQKMRSIFNCVWSHGKIWQKQFLRLQFGFNKTVVEREVDP